MSRGFYDDCLKQCIPPHYGEDCQSECNCGDGYYCHFADGCSRSFKADDAANKKIKYNMNIHTCTTLYHKFIKGNVL